MGFLHPIKIRVAGLTTIASLLGCVAILTACSTWEPAGAPESSVGNAATGGRPVQRIAAVDDKYIVKRVWDDAQFGFVRIEQAEAGAPSNDHPVKFAPQQISAVLAELQLESASGSKQPVFIERELKDLSEPLATALAEAGPGHDVTFAVTGRTGLRLNFLKPKRLTTGRVFFRDDQLNVIFGIVHGDFQGKLRGSGVLIAYTPGSRNKRVQQFGTVLPSETLLYANIERQDWIRVASLPGAPATSTAVVAAEPEPVILSTQTGAPPSTQTTLRRRYTPSTTPTRRPTPSTTTTTRPAPSTTTSTAPRRPPAVAPAPSTRQTQTAARTPPAPRPSTSSAYQGGARHYQDVEDRLKGLQRLRDQGLITDREYQEKRRELLQKL